MEKTRCFMCFAPAVDEAGGKAYIVVMRMPVEHARTKIGRMTDVDRCPSRRVRLLQARLEMVY